MASPSGYAPLRPIWFFVLATFAEIWVLSKLFTAWVFRSGQSEVLAHASISRTVQQEGKKQAGIPRDV